MTVVATPPVKRPEADESVRVQEEAALRHAQSAKAREVRLERHARRAPDIRDLLDDRNAHAAAVDELRRKLAKLESQHTELGARHTELSADFERLAEEKAAMQIERDSFKQSLDEQIAGRVSDGNVLRDRIEDLEKQLASALKQPKARGSG